MINGTRAEIDDCIQYCARKYSRYKFLIKIMNTKSNYYNIHICQLKLGFINFDKNKDKFFYQIKIDFF